MFEFLSTDVLIVFFQVVMIDLALAGDNAIVIGVAAAGLPQARRGKAILIGILAATVLRILLAGLATQILQTVGLPLAGGILLLWVCWKLWRELHSSSAAPIAGMEAAGAVAGTDAEGEPRKTLVQAIWQIILADVSMSLDNVLAVAGAAREHPVILIFGLALSIAMMGAAASFIARLLQNHRWIAYVGLAIILYVAVEMIFRGTLDIMRVASDMTLHTAASLPAAVPDIVKRRDFRVKAVILSGSQHVRRDVGRSLTIAKPVPRRSRQRVDRLSLSACHLLACHSRFGRCSVSRVLRRSRSSSIMRAVGEEVGRLL